MVAGDFRQDSTFVQRSIYLIISAILSGSFRDCPWPGRDYRTLGRSFTSLYFDTYLQNREGYSVGSWELSTLKALRNHYSVVTEPLCIPIVPMILNSWILQLIFLKLNVIFTSLHPKHIHRGHFPTLCFPIYWSNYFTTNMYRKKRQGVAFF